MSVKKKLVKVITEAAVRRLIAKERKLWEQDKLFNRGSRNSEQLETARIYGRTLTEMDRRTAHRQTNCDHSVIKHQFTHGDIWVRCLRCGKWWKPPIRSQYKQDRDFWRAMFEYEEAVNFQTNNTMSSSVQCKFHTTNPKGDWI
jgi:hypothetical protein